MGLNREVLKWIQSLDLAYSIKNPKRDFANGFLVAEIFSRYYSKDVQMHSFDNGASMAVRMDNWKQLMKLFRKRGLSFGKDPFTEVEMKRIVKCEAGAVSSFLHDVYETLTGRKLQPPPEKPTGGFEPPYSKATASSLMKDTLKSPEMLGIHDEASMEHKLKEQMEQHEVELQNERSANPARFIPKKAMGKTGSQPKILRGTSRAVGEASAPQTITVRKVKVKHIDRNIAHLRASKELNAGGSSMVAVQQETQHQPGSGGMEMSTEARVTDLLISTIQSAAEAIELQLEGEDVVYEFTDSLHRPSSSPWLDGVISDLTDKREMLVEACLLNPKEFWQLVSFLTDVVSHCCQSPGLDRAVDLFEYVASGLIAQSPSIARRLFEDFALEKMTAVLAKQQCRRDILRVMYAFSPVSPSSHLGLLKTLKDKLNDMKTFLHVVGITVHMEQEFDKSLADMYHYYALIGSTHASPQIRSASLRILAYLGRTDVSLLLDCLSSLRDMTLDTWWEVKAQLLVCCSVLLQQLAPTESREPGAPLEIVYGMVKSLLLPTNSGEVLAVGVSHLAGCLQAHGEFLLPIFVEAAVALPYKYRMMLMSDETLVLSLAGAGVFALLPVLPHWNPADVALQLGSLLSSAQPDRLEVGHVETLLAALTTRPSLPEEEIPAWMDVFEGVKDYLFVALADPMCTDAAGKVFVEYARQWPDRELVFDLPELAGAMRMVLQDCVPICMESMLDTLSRLARESPLYGAACAKFLDKYAAEARSPLPNEFQSLLMSLK